MQPYRLLQVTRGRWGQGQKRSRHTNLPLAYGSDKVRIDPRDKITRIPGAQLPLPGRPPIATDIQLFSEHRTVKTRLQPLQQVTVDLCNLAVQRNAFDNPATPAKVNTNAPLPLKQPSGKSPINNTHTVCHRQALLASMSRLSEGACRRRPILAPLQPLQGRPEVALLFLYPDETQTQSLGSHPGCGCAREGV